MEEEKKENSNWFKNHTDTLAVIAALAGGFLWTDGKIESLSNRVNNIENRLISIETVLIVKNIMPCQMAKTETENK